MLKRLSLLAIASLLVVAFSMSAKAEYQLDTADLRYAGAGPYVGVHVHFPSGADNTWVTGVYKVEIMASDPFYNFVGILNGFCIHDADAQSSPDKYGMWTIDDKDYKFKDAAWIADQYFSGGLASVIGSTDKNKQAAAAQLAIWEITIENGSTFFDLDPSSNNAGNLWSNNSTYRGYAQNVYAALQTAKGNSSYTAFDPKPWALALHPENSPPPPGGPDNYQDYLVPRIPEPGTMILLGTGVLGLYGYVRRKRKLT